MITVRSRNRLGHSCIVEQSRIAGWIACIVFGFVIAISADAAAQSGVNPLRLEAKIPLGSVAGRIDHMAFDLVRRRLFVAELGNDTVGIIDLNEHKVTHRLTGLKEPQGVAYLAANDSLYVANGGDGSVRIFRGPDYLTAGRIDFGADADNLRIDKAANRILVGYGSGAIAVIDPVTNNKEKTFALGAHPESFQVDAQSRLFVNVPDRRSITVLDRSSGRVVSRWPMPHGSNFPMALDNERGNVLVAFRHPAKFTAFNKQNGHIVDELDICDDADDVFLDSKHSRIYISCGAGFLDVLAVDNQHYRRMARIPTASGARTAFFVPEIDRLLLGVRARGAQAAEVWVYGVAE